MRVAGSDRLEAPMATMAAMPPVAIKSNRTAANAVVCSSAATTYDGTS